MKKQKEYTKLELNKKRKQEDKIEKQLNKLVHRRQNKKI